MQPKKILTFFVATFAGFTLSAEAGPLIIDHACVDLYTNLSEADVARVKTMFVDILGQSHSLGYRVGCQLLQSNVDSRFQVNEVTTYPPEGYTTNHLRIANVTYVPMYNTWQYGQDEQSWYSIPGQSISNNEVGLSYCNTNNLAISVFGLGWSWQFSWHNVDASIDPEYEVHWAGSSTGGADGDLAWGLNDQSYPYTTNHISMDTYLQATEQYRAYCKTNGYSTVVIFTTAPVDYNQDNAYQAYLKNQYIRNYVSNTTDGVLFDYADIECWDNAGNRATNAWTDLGGNPQIYEWIAPDNYLNLDGGDGTTNNPSYHIGERGAIRLAKALWYMLGRLSEPPTNFTMVASSESQTNMTIQWPSALLGTYSVLQSSNFTTWNIAATNLAGTYPTNSYAVPIQNSGQVFYRIQQN